MSVTPPRFTDVCPDFTIYVTPTETGWYACGPSPLTLKSVQHPLLGTAIRGAGSVARLDLQERLEAQHPPCAEPAYRNAVELHVDFLPYHGEVFRGETAFPFRIVRVMLIG